MEADGQPLVSCICVTHNSIGMLERSVKCFRDQTYSNKELILGFTDDNKGAAALAEQLNDQSIRKLIFENGMKMSLGEKRNAVIRKARGEYFCVWDDDDWHHMNRIEDQVQSLANTGLRSSTLSNIILYDYLTRDAYVSATRQGWEQTLLCEKSLFEDPGWRYQNLDRGEDSALVYSLMQRKLMRAIPSPHLYIYVYHAGNVFHRGHWEVNLLPWARKLSPHSAAVVQDILQGALSNPAASAALRDLF